MKMEFLLQTAWLAQLLRHYYRCGRFRIRIPGRSNRTQIHQRCDVSLELCLPDAKPRRWAPPLVTRFDVILRVTGILRLDF